MRYVWNSYKQYHPFTVARNNTTETATMENSNDDNTNKDEGIYILSYG